MDECKIARGVPLKTPDWYKVLTFSVYGTIHSSSEKILEQNIEDDIRGMLRNVYDSISHWSLYMQSYDGDQGSLFPTYQIEGIPLLEPIKHDEFEYQVVTKVLRQAMLKVKPATYVADFPKLTRRSGALLTDPGEKETVKRINCIRS